MRSPKVLGFFLIASCIAFLALSISQSNSSRYLSNTSFARTPIGLTTFVALAKAVAPDKVIQRRAALLAQEDLNPAGIFVTLSPKSAFSEREASLVKSFADEGGRVIISAQSPESLGNLEYLLSSLGITVRPTEMEDFTNGVTTRVVPGQEGAFLSPHFAYEFYSRYFANDSAQHPLVIEKSVGKGSATLFMGVPPISNALIGRGDNWRIAHAILSTGGPVFLDEYHHLFSDKTLADLLVEPSFAFPIFGMVFVGLLFFLFGRLSKHDAWERAPEPPQARSFHHFGASLFQGLLKRAKLEEQAVAEHEAFLKRLFPEAASQLEGGEQAKGAWLVRGAQLVELHKGLMRQRGWKV